MNVVYIFFKDGFLFALDGSTGGYLYEHQVAIDGVLPGPNVLFLAVEEARSLVSKYTSARVVFVPDWAAHPEVVALMHDEDSPPEEEPHMPGRNLCTDCVHTHVCEGAAVGRRMELTISACGAYVGTEGIV